MGGVATVAGGASVAALSRALEVETLEPALLAAADLRSLEVGGSTWSSSAWAMATSVMVSLNPEWSPPGGVGLDRGEAGGSGLSSSSGGAGVGVGGTNLTAAVPLGSVSDPPLRP